MYTHVYVCARPILFTVLKSRISDHHIDGNASKPRISKMHNVQETQKTVSKQARNRVFATFIFQGSYAVVKNGSFLPKPQNVINFLDFCFYCLVYS